MKPFALLIVGAVFGWAASDVDWTRDAVGQTGRFVPLDAKPDPPATLQAEISDATQQPTSRAVPAEPGPGAAPRKADGNFVDAPVAGSVQPPTPLTATTQANLADAQRANVPADGPRRVFESRMVNDANGNLRPVTVSRMVNADGSVGPETLVAQQPPYAAPAGRQINATAIAHPLVSGLVGRFQATAYGSPSGHGCYVVDTMTGKTWHVANGQPAQVVTDALAQQAEPTETPWSSPDQGLATGTDRLRPRTTDDGPVYWPPRGGLFPPTPNNVVPTPSTLERSPLVPEPARVPQNESVVEPTPTQTPDQSDAD